MEARKRWYNQSEDNNSNNKIKTYISAIGDGSIFMNRAFVARQPVFR